MAPKTPDSDIIQVKFDTTSLKDFRKELAGVEDDYKKMRKGGLKVSKDVGRKTKDLTDQEQKLKRLRKESIKDQKKASDIDSEYVDTLGELTDLQKERIRGLSKEPRMFRSSGKGVKEYSAAVATSAASTKALSAHTRQLNQAIANVQKRSIGSGLGKDLDGTADSAENLAEAMNTPVSKKGLFGVMTLGGGMGLLAATNKTAGGLQKVGHAANSLGKVAMMVGSRFFTFLKIFSVAQLAYAAAKAVLAYRKEVWALNKQLKDQVGWQGIMDSQLDRLPGKISTLMGQGIEDSQRRINKFINEVADTGVTLKFRIDRRQQAEIAGMFSQQGIYLYEIDREGQKASDAIESVMRNSAAFGKEINETVGMMADMSSEFGYSLSTIDDVLTDIAGDAFRAGVSTNAFLSSVQRVQREFKIYKENLGSVSKLMGHITTKGTVSAEDAAENVSNIVSEFQGLGTIGRVSRLSSLSAGAGGKNVYNKYAGAQATSLQADLDEVKSKMQTAGDKEMPQLTAQMQDLEQAISELSNVASGKAGALEVGQAARHFDAYSTMGPIVEMLSSKMGKSVSDTLSTVASRGQKGLSNTQLYAAGATMGMTGEQFGDWLDKNKRTLEGLNDVLGKYQSQTTDLSEAIKLETRDKAKQRKLDREKFEAEAMMNARLEKESSVLSSAWDEVKGDLSDMGSDLWQFAEAFIAPIKAALGGILFAILKVTGGFLKLFKFITPIFKLPLKWEVEWLENVRKLSTGGGVLSSLTEAFTDLWKWLSEAPDRLWKDIDTKGIGEALLGLLTDILNGLAEDMLNIVSRIPGLHWLAKQSGKIGFGKSAPGSRAGPQTPGVNVGVSQVVHRGGAGTMAPAGAQSTILHRSAARRAAAQGATPSTPAPSTTPVASSAGGVLGTASLGAAVVPGLVQQLGAGKMGGTSTGTKALLDRISMGEGTSDATAQKHGYASGYDVPLAFGKYGGAAGTTKPLSQMTIGEVKALQSQILNNPSNNMNSSAVGKYQIVGKTLRGLQNKMGFKDTDVFSPELQDKMATELLKGRGLDSYLAGKMGDDQFQGGLANEWASIQRPGMSTALQHTGTTTSQIREAMQTARGTQVGTSGLPVQVATALPQASSTASSGGNVRGDTNINVTVNAQTNADPHDIANTVTSAINQSQAKESRSSGAA